MKTYLLAILLAIAARPAFVAAQVSSPPETSRPPTFCNPVDLNYRFALSPPSRREAADPTMVRFQNEFWLFASKSGGYWHTADFIHWTYVVPTGLPLEDYAPTVEIIGGKMVYTAFNSKAIFTTDDPAAGRWSKIARVGAYGDPDLFADTDGRVYVYFGSSNKVPLKGVELDPKNHFAEVRKPEDLLGGDPFHHGWERPLDKISGVLVPDNPGDKEIHRPYVEGSWMNKFKGHYYLQYAAPGTQWNTYSDGVYVSDRPLGPFHYAAYSPFARKATGFVGGTGHGSTFQDAQGGYWHIDTLCISVRHEFERRIGIFPAGFVPSGNSEDQLVCQTYLGDYPQYAPGVVTDPLQNNSPGWMLLSYRKKAQASSTFRDSFPDLAFDENIKTWWSAATGNPGEWLSVDLAKRCQIQAIQINFADQLSTSLGRVTDDAYRYKVEISDDGKAWSPCVSRENNTREAPHEYVQLDRPVLARYVRLTNVHTPGGALFSVSGLRIFGSGLGDPPAKATGLIAKRQTDQRQATLNWSPVKDADFYIVRYGIAPDRLFQNVQVYGQTTFQLDDLNTGTPYFMTVDTVNDSGVTKGTEVVPIN